MMYWHNKFLILLLCTYFTINGQSIYLNRIFHHENQINQSHAIELGNIVLYLDQYPKVTESVTQQDGKKQYVFFLPDVEIKSKEVLDSINYINTKKDVQSLIEIVQTNTPQKGLQIRITYNNIPIGVEYNLFDSISLHKGVVFRLYNTTLIEKLKRTNKPILKTAFNMLPKVVIDCGHGGSDFGAIGAHGTKEKDVTLQVGLAVALLLREKNILVDMTRNQDIDKALDQRTTFANLQKADLFVSIHANAAQHPRHTGIETYCLKENLFLTDNHCQGLHNRLQDKYNDSFQLAKMVHQSVLASVPSEYGLIDRNVKHAVAQVLLGTSMPAILVEMGYLTNEKEEKLLAQEQYQSLIAQGIAQGIDLYIHNAYVI